MSINFHRLIEVIDQNRLIIIDYIDYLPGLQITNGQAPVTLSGQTSFCSNTTRFWPVKFFNSLNSCDSEPRLHSNPFITKKQQNPSRFGNKNNKLIVLLLFTAEAASHSVRGMVTQDTTAIVRFTLNLAKSLIIKYYTLAITTSFLQIENFSERVGKGPDKMSGNPRICPVNTQF